MIVIKKIELIETPNDWYEYYEMDFPGFAGTMPNACTDKEIQRRMVRGRRFYRSDGEEVICTTIGVTEEAADILGLQYEEWERMEKNYKDEIKYLDKSFTICSKERQLYLNAIPYPSGVLKIFFMLFYPIQLEKIKKVFKWKTV